MLQRIHDSVGRWVAGIILGLLAVTFVFWGVNYTQSAAQFAAKVNGEDIPLAEFDRALRDRENQFRQANRIELDDDTQRLLRRAVVQDLVRTEALLQRVEENGYRVSAGRVVEFMRSIPQFRAGDQFSRQLAETVLANQNMSIAMFEQMQRRRMTLFDFESGLVESTFLTPTEFRRYIELLRQRREIAYATFAVDTFLERVTINDAEIEAHYEANTEDYQTTESVDLEYLEIRLADVAAGIEVTDAELRDYYDDNRTRFESVEERFVRHILFTVDDDTTEDAARTAAQGALERIRGGADFAAVAAEVSDDVGTRQQGGELGWITPGMFDGPLEEAFYSTAVGEVAGPVRSDFGFHLVKIDNVRSAEVQPFETMREALLEEYRARLAEDTFYERVTELDEAAYTAEDELASVAAEMGLEVKTADGFPRTGDREVFANSEAVVQAAFDDKILLNGRNSEVVELADDHALVLRVAEYHPAATQPLDAVREQIRAQLQREQAQGLAERAASAFFTALQALPADGDPAALAAEHDGKWQAAAWVERTDATLPTQLLSAAFAMARPAPGEARRAQVALASGDQIVFVLTGVEAGTPESIAEAERERGRIALAQSSAQSEVNAYIDNVVSGSRVVIPEETIEPQL